MEFSRQEYWRLLPFPSSRDLPYPGFEPRSPALQAHCLLSEPPGKPEGETPAVKMPDWVAVSLLWSSRGCMGRRETDSKFCETSSLALNSNSLQYSCLENSTDRGAWQATAHGVTKSWTGLRD